MSDEMEWVAPGPGPWARDRSHFPYMVSKMAGELLPESFGKGFQETLAKYGALIDRLQPAVINGFLYIQAQPLDMPGPDGPKSPEWIGAEIGRRTEVAAGAFANKIWFDDLRKWDNDLKPKAIARHRELWLVDLDLLTDAEIAAHLLECMDHLRAMVYQHHRFNASTLAPIGDFALQTSGMVGMSPVALFAALDGTSPVSGIVNEEILPAIEAVKKDATAEALVRGSGDPVARVASLRARVPAVAQWLAGTEYRIVDGLDITRPTFAECHGMILSRLASALDAAGPEEAIARGEAFAASVRERVPADQHAYFDDLLASARAVNRLRDERAIYSDTAAMGILRRAMLAIGTRLVARGQLDDPSEALEASGDELLGLLRGDAPLTAADLQARTTMRAQLGAKFGPQFVGGEPPPPPPVDMLPPPLARSMSAIGFTVDGVLGQMPQPTGSEKNVIGIGVGAASFEGRARVVLEFDELFSLEPGEVLVTPATMESFNAMLHLVGAIVTDHGSFASHAAIMARELGIPAVVGTVDGTRRISTGDMVRVNAPTGEVTIVS